MTSQRIGEEKLSLGRADGLSQFDGGRLGLWALIALAAALVAPPFFFLVKSSLQVPLPGFQTEFGLGNYRHVLLSSSVNLWLTTVEYAVGSACVSIVLGFSVAWIVARTNAPLQRLVFVAAFLSMATPLLVKDIGWILLLGPNDGLVNIWLRNLFDSKTLTIPLFSLGGMIAIEGLLWAPIAFLLALPPLRALDPSLEEAAAMSGAGRMTTLFRVVLPLARPSILAILLLSLIRAFESFETPLLIGMPGGVTTITTALYESIEAGFLPRYGDACAYAVLLVVIVAAPLALYHLATRAAGRYATLTGKGFRRSRIDLGAWKWPCAAFALIIPLSLLAPLILMIWASFQPIYVNPTFADFGKMSLANYAAIWTRDDARVGLLNSLVVGAASASFVALMGLAASWMVARRREPARWILDALCSAPLILPGVALGIAMLVLALQARVLAIYGTLWVIGLAFVVKFLPYGVRFCYAGVLSLNKELEESARSSGASQTTVLRRIVLPLTLPSIFATWTYVFMYSVRDLATIVLLSGAKNLMVSMVVLDQWSNGEVPSLAALSVVVAFAAASAALLFMRLTAGRDFSA
jgi:iron(III) transport system permease protein